jgi:hypothetical protein
MRTWRAAAGAAAALVLAAGGARAEWQVSAEVRAGAVRTDDLTDVQSVQDWGVDTVTSATPKTSERFLAGEANLTAAYVESDTSRVVGVHAVGDGGRSTPYAQLSVNNLILAWHGAAGDLEAGYVLTPSSWGQGLLVNRLRFAGGRGRLDWDGSGRTEVLWTNTLEDPARFRYYELALTGLHHTTTFSGGEVGLAVLDARQSQPDVYPKHDPTQATFAGVHAAYSPAAQGQVFTELGYAWLTDGARSGAGTAGTRWALGPDLQALATLWYLAPRFNPVSGFYGRYGVEEGAARFSALWTPAGLGLDLRPGFGWKQQYAGNFWMPSLELVAQYAPWGVSLRAYEYAEQPWGRWGDVDHWEYTQAVLAWQVFPPLTLLVRWEKIYNGFDRTKSQQLSGEIACAF